LKKWYFIVAAFAVVGYISYSLYLLYSENYSLNTDEYQVLIAYSKDHKKKANYVKDAYQSVLAEEGVPCGAVEIATLCQTPAQHVARNTPAIIFPDALLQSMPEQALAWTKAYLNHGGSLAIIYDVGIRDYRGKSNFRKQAMLSDIVGVNYMTFDQYKEKSYTTGKIKFNDKAAADLFQIPPGKLTDDFILSGHFYGGLDYPVARTQRLETTPPETIFAQILTPEGEKYPAVVLKKYGRGNVLYVNLPLGHLKSNTDDLPLRAFLRTFLFQTVKVPHLVSTNQGTGKLVINWHIDSNEEWADVAPAIAKKYLDQALRASIHIVAGDFHDQQDDGTGFDACGRGKAYAMQYLPYGIIGSRGGWAHNWFAKKLEQFEKHKVSGNEIKKNIDKNRTCLESITKYPVVEYSSPAGVHPQPDLTIILEEMGFNSYYYTGDSGSAPNRTFVNGKMVSKTVIAFPIIPNKKFASLFEMKEAGLTEKDVQKWLTDSVDYVIEKRTTRLFFSRLHEIDEYPEAVLHFLEYAKLKQAKGELQVEPMSDIARFFLKFLKTKYVFRLQENNLSILLKNTDGLKGITVAVPKKNYRMATIPGISQAKDEDYYYLTVVEDVKEKNIIVQGI